VDCLEPISSSNTLLIRENGFVVEAAQNGLKWPGGKIDEYVHESLEISLSVTVLTLHRTL